MNDQILKTRLEQLLALILRERECAKALEIEELSAVTQEKEALLDSLGELRGGGPEVRQLAERIRTENRRNAYLLWSALTWVRETMQFFGKQTAPSGYGAAGTRVYAGGSYGGRLLSGRV